jgi:hypothetical protein
MCDMKDCEEMRERGYLDEGVDSVRVLLGVVIVVACQSLVWLVTRPPSRVG